MMTPELEKQSRLIKMAHGGGRNGAGRKAGSVSKATKDIREACRKHTDAMVKELVRLATSAEAESTRVAAIKEILDRAWGKSPQAHTGEGGEGPVELTLLMKEIDGATRGLPSDPRSQPATATTRPAAAALN